MKKLLLLLVFMPFVLSAQDSLTAKKNKTLIDFFSAEAGQFYKKEYITAGQIDNTQASILLLTNMNTKKSIYGLHFEMIKQLSYSTITYTANLDADEIGSLVTSLHFIKDNVLVEVPNNYTEYNFNTRDDFSAGCYWSLRQKKWRIYIQLDRYLSSTMIDMNTSDLGELLNIFEKSKAKIDSLEKSN